MKSTVYENKICFQKKKTEVDDTPLQSHFPLKREVGIRIRLIIHEKVFSERENGGKRYSFTIKLSIEKGGRN